MHKAKSELALGFGSKALKAAEAARTKIEMAQESSARAQMLADLAKVTSEAERILKAATPKSMPVSKIPKDSALNSHSFELRCGPSWSRRQADALQTVQHVLLLQRCLPKEALADAPAVLLAIASISRAMRREIRRGEDG